MSLRLLLLGKAHYGVKPEEDSPELTQQVIAGVRDGTRHEPFFTKAADLVRDVLLPSTATRADFWNSVAFANYIPVTVGQGVHDAPTAQMWERAHDRLIELLESLAPTHVLSLGKEQWNAIHFPESWSSSALRQTPQGTIRLWRSPKVAVIATPIDHPTASFGFAPDKWREHIRTFLSSDLAVLASEDR